MINEKMLEYLMLERVLYNNEDIVESKFDRDTYVAMIERMLKIEDEFINEYKLTLPLIKNPVKDTIT